MNPIIAETEAVDLPDRDLKLKIVATLEKDIDGTTLLFLTHHINFDKTWTKTNWKILLSPKNWSEFKKLVEEVDKIMGKGSLTTSLNCYLPPMPPIDFQSKP
ncbi:MAG: hypothetical protein A2V65_03945 [Deltaproteobacteria bacterium RBG_13_49_15]|nr:MAG: hypothetical protein A2V65_03945 [Deltaproteobacteria bacterium RBG_13_49_15]